MRSPSLTATGLLALALAIPTTVAVQAPFNLQYDPLAFASTSSVDPVHFAGQKVIRFSTENDAQHKKLLEQAHALALDVWGAKLGAACGADSQSAFGCVDIRMASGTADEDPFRALASADEIMAQLMQPFQENLRSKTLIEDLDQLLQEQSRSAEASIQSGGKARDWHKQYHNLEEIEAYMSMLENSYPGHVRVEEIGKTHEGRSILALKLGQGLPTQPPPSPPQDPQPQPPPPPSNITSLAPKTGILITAGQHAREWISTSTSLFFASDLLHAALGPPANVTTMKKKKSRKGRKKNTWTRSSALAVLKTFTITIIPVSNPDGYTYSWTKNRMWRKNRQPNKFPSGLFCKGVDLNRNYGFAFASSALASPCSEMYPGTTPFSSAETTAIGRYLQAEENNVRAYFDLHSYGQLMMYPFSYDCSQPVADEEDLLELALGAVSAVKKVHGRQFSAGKVCAVYAEGGGNSIDWSYASSEPVPGTEAEKRRVKWSFSVELRDGGTYGFLLPPKQIIPAGEEVSAGLRYMLDFIGKKEH
ncbi:zinc carboxypeptidase A [Pseudozyma hubeiensis SY62]|uniref:Inactive metallocarboxypeptidase ECM14 n=1 Tax=Pseudozyma hubeiensis (strain SY62) TaxID=1305764 RepID=R9P305_PSEHS|nr:zinc carboxypeptidase A [Pseudozyma hubeiensis SY62]GAC95726.1 zinc carboxypeptidase A [Pseudozyma hubeiensis SY62]